MNSYLKYRKRISTPNNGIQTSGAPNTIRTSPDAPERNVDESENQGQDLWAKKEKEQRRKIKTKMKKTQRYKEKKKKWKKKKNRYQNDIHHLTEAANTYKGAIDEVMLKHQRLGEFTNHMMQRLSQIDPVFLQNLHKHLGYN